MAENHLIKIILVIMVFILVFLYVRYLEKRTLYFPLRTVEATPKDIGLNYEEISLYTHDGVQLSAWFIPSENPRATVLFCHGNGGNISHRLEKIKIFNALDLNVLIFDYRGYGMSTGSPSENGLYLDAETVYGYFTDGKSIPAQKIIAYGESLGAAVAVNLAGKHDLGGIIIEGGFTSVGDMAKRIFPFIPTFIYSSRYDVLEKIKDIKYPKLIFHSADDEVVPFELGE
ncbi:MAG: alpha/beta hydrolase, partial [Candidatus Mariimomonas ferrooxydans]